MKEETAKEIIKRSISASKKLDVLLEKMKEECEESEFRLYQRKVAMF